LSLAVDRWGGSKNLQRIALVKDVGGVMRPGYEFAIGKSDLIRYPGFGENPAAARQEAQRLLKEAGAEKISFKLLNRTIAMPYTSVGLFLIDQWRQIGIDVSHQQVETAAYNASLQSGNYDASLSAVCDYMDDPSIQLLNYISKDRSSLNYGGYVDRKLDDLYERQKRASDKQERIRLIREFEHQLYTESYAVPVIWWNRVIVHHAQLKNWHVTPSAYLGQQFIDVWLDR
jgi:peptide/nickel transport system substrate-binding protein